jgi:hypothetical protein
MTRCYLIDVNLEKLASTLCERVPAQRRWTEQEADGWLRQLGMKRTDEGWLCECSPSQVLARGSYTLLDRYGWCRTCRLRADDAGGAGGASAIASRACRAA